MEKALLIMGPTASGKSALGLALAQRLGGVVINADALQLYADLRVLSARPSPAEEAAAPHALYGVLDGAERGSVGRWLDLAAAAIAAAHGEGRTPILVGGTGLYFKALTEGLDAAPATPADMHEALMAQLAARGAPALHAELAAADPAAAARLNPRDAPRILRALARAALGGGAAAPAPPVLAPGTWAGLALTPPRDALYAAIDGRFAQMLAAGALEEAARLAARGLAEDLPVMKAHGAPWLRAHLAGAMSLDEAAALSRRDTRRYAKRQFTWIRGQLSGWMRVEAGALEARIAAALALRASG